LLQLLEQGAFRRSQSAQDWPYAADIHALSVMDNIFTVRALRPTCHTPNRDGAVSHSIMNEAKTLPKTPD
jgi:hypothetical protein